MGRDERRKAVAAEVLARRSQDIEKRWLAGVRAQSDVSGVDPTALRDAMPDYLARISEALLSEEPMQEQSGTAWCDVAREHGSMRVGLGFDIEQLAEEFVILRRVVVEVLREE